MTTRRAPLADLAAGTRTLDAGPSRYLHRVLRLVANDAFVAFDPKAAVEADARIVRVESGAVVVEIGTPRPAAVTAPRQITWLQGLAKGDKCDAIVRDATELGAASIVLVETERSVVRLDDARATARIARWERIANEAARQSLRGDAPSISTAAWSDAMTSLPPDTTRIVLHPRATQTLASIAGERAHTLLASPTAFAVGAEGGLTDSELEIALKNGWIAASIGPVVLRTETMAAAVLGALHVLA